MTHEDQTEFYECPLCGVGTGNDIDGTVEHECEIGKEMSLQKESEWDLDCPDVWRSKKHSDGELAFGGTWFVLGIGKENGKQMTYHLPIDRWDECGFAETLEQAPEFDGHSSDDVLKRLKNL